jgi:hypothetical protein
MWQIVVAVVLALLLVGTLVWGGEIYYEFQNTHRE